MRAYDERGMVRAADTREQARAELVDGWDRERRADPARTTIILIHTNDQVRELNGEARERVRASGGLGADVNVTADRGERAFAPGDRVMFLRNERDMGVKNGSLGTIEAVTPDRMSVRLDSGKQVAFDLKDYGAVDHGYAATFHKAQGVTVDRGHVLATPGMDRHSAYVGLSRHRDGVALHYGRDDFADQARLVRALSRDRGKDMAGDYAPQATEQDRARAFAERREIAARISGRPHAPTRQRATREAVVQRWTAEHGRELAGVRARAQRAGKRAQGMYGRHEARREAHARTQPLPPRGLLAAFKRPSYETARGAWEKTARVLQRRSHQLAGRVDRLREYLGPVTGQRRHRGDELARRRVEREHPNLAKLHEAVMREQRIERARQQEQERERIREQRERDRGRDDRGRGR